MFIKNPVLNCDLLKITLDYSFPKYKLYSEFAYIGNYLNSLYLGYNKIRNKPNITKEVLHLNNKFCDFINKHSDNKLIVRYHNDNSMFNSSLNKITIGKNEITRENGKNKVTINEHHELKYDKPWDILKHELTPNVIGDKKLNKGNYKIAMSMIGSYKWKMKRHIDVDEDDINDFC